MKPHKWHKEIKAWADGAEIESKSNHKDGEWFFDRHPSWIDEINYRIKPQPKEPQYLYVYNDDGCALISFAKPSVNCKNCVGKIKLEIE
jgi:hypothetical protein